MKNRIEKQVNMYLFNIFLIKELKGLLFDCATNHLIRNRVYKNWLQNQSLRSQLPYIGEFQEVWTDRKHFCNWLRN